MSEHTPGPWRVHPAPYGWDIFNPWCDEIQPQWVAAVHETVGAMSERERLGAYPSRDECAANARLIAAAPDLLEFAKAHDAYMAVHYSGPDSDALHPDAANNWRMCRAAIAQAEGSAP